jgi:IS30 family transposase
LSGAKNSYIANW